ncbi:hypothetical protein E2C01_079816 [Portunus trituberculatus]|nr:hypothetical protein [Portunus trituberculatus]
MDHITDP